MRVQGGRYCAAVNCSNSSKARQDLVFFKFPKNAERCKKWIINCGREDLHRKSVDRVNKNCNICAEHFERSQFMNDSRCRLVWNAVPTLFDVPNNQEPKANVQNTERPEQAMEPDKDIVISGNQALTSFKKKNQAMEMKVRLLKQKNIRSFQKRKSISKVSQLENILHKAEQVMQQYLKEKDTGGDADCGLGGERRRENNLKRENEITVEELQADCLRLEKKKLLLEIQKLQRENELSKQKFTLELDKIKAERGKIETETEYVKLKIMKLEMDLDDG